MSSDGAGYVFRPSTVEGIRQVYQLAVRTGRSIGFRGKYVMDAPDVETMNEVFTPDQ